MDSFKEIVAKAALDGAQLAVAMQLSAEYNVEIITSEPLQRQLRVWHPSNGSRYFVIKVSEPI